MIQSLLKKSKKSILDPLLIDAVLAKLPSYNQYLWKDSNGKTKRITINFGYSFIELEQNKKKYIEMPQEIEALKQAAFKKVCSQVPKVKDASFFDNVIITIYEKGHFLEPHVDVDADDTKAPPRNFYFEDPILDVILVPDETSSLSFTYHDKPGKPSMSDPVILKAIEKKGEVCILEGKLRSKPYFHYVPPASKLRISVTFRKVTFKT